MGFWAIRARTGSFLYYKLYKISFSTFVWRTSSSNNLFTPLFSSSLKHEPIFRLSFKRTIYRYIRNDCWACYVVFGNSNPRVAIPPKQPVKLYWEAIPSSVVYVVFCVREKFSSQKNIRNKKKESSSYRVALQLRTVFHVFEFNFPIPKVWIVLVLGVVTWVRQIPDYFLLLVFSLTCYDCISYASDHVWLCFLPTEGIDNTRQPHSRTVILV